jgi:hypothetical protein
MAIHVGAMYLPIGQVILGAAPVPIETWLVLGAVAATIAVAMELHKLSWRSRSGSSSRRTRPPAAAESGEREEAEPNESEESKSTERGDVDDDR